MESFFYLDGGGEVWFKKKNVFLKNGYLEYISLPKIGLDKDRIQFYTFITILEERESKKKNIFMVNSENYKFHFKGLSTQFKRDPQMKMLRAQFTTVTFTPWAEQH